ncbi:hypothetical protein ES702_04096 [subsurface metagenome]
MWLKIGNEIINMDQVTGIEINADYKIFFYLSDGRVSEIEKSSDYFDSLRDYLEKKFESYVI